MRRRAPADEIQLLSTSFLDLLCCGLCSVVLLWVLTGSGQKARPDEPFGFVQVGQTGIWHWQSLEVYSADGVTKLLDINTGLPDRVVEQKVAELQQRWKLTAYIRRGGDSGDDFAGLLMLAADKTTTDLQVRVVFRPCAASNDVHVIRVTGQSGPRRLEDSVVYTVPVALAGALTNPGLKARYDRSVRTALPVTGNEPTAVFRFDVKGGRLSYSAPDAPL